MANNRGEPLPDFILNAPELDEVDMPYFEAYVALDGLRQIGFGGVGSIPWFSIIQYGQYLELDPEDLDDFIDVIVLTDNFVLKKVHESQESS